MTTLNLHTLTDCGCKAKVYADGSGVDIEHCNLHHAAPDLLAALKVIDDAFISGDGAAMQGGIRMARAAIAEIEG